DTEGELRIELKKDTENEPDIKLDEDIDIELDKDVDINGEPYNDKCISNDTDNNQLEHYACQNNFVIRKKWVDNSCDLCQRTWDCERSDKYGPDNETIIKLTSMHLEHKGGDAANLLQYFEKEHAKNPDWYVQSWIDPETNRLQDIILNDNTAATNTYNLPLSIFAIVDNNFRSQIIAQAILPDETSENLESVVPEIYTNTYLLHYVWHIGHNLEKQLAKLLGD
ncbi:4794_t:CDS:2, partial [Racocetra fulgida]